MIASFEGELIAPEDVRYEAARRVWNGLIDRRPGLIARCRSVADVQSVVNLAREQRLLVTVRGGGHQVAGTAVCDRGLVIDLEVVTADGSLVKASRDEHADLFWALRGGGRGLGVVTRFEYRLHPIGPEVMVSTVFYPFEQARQVFRGFRTFTRHAPDEITSQLLFWTVPSHPVLPASVHRQRVVIVIGLFAGRGASSCDR